jgi:hypothetical protein
MSDDPFAQWDAAFVLGALSPTERHEYEEHLAHCAECRRAVAELTPTAGLLTRVSADDARSTMVPAASAEGRDELARARFAIRARTRTRRTRWIAAAAAAVLVAAGVAIPLGFAAADRPAASFALQDVVDVPLTASVQLHTTDWGTRIDLDCRYPKTTGGPADGWEYALAVVGDDGSDTVVSTWRARPGVDAQVSAGTALQATEIRAVEIRTMTGVVIMRHELGAKTE